MKTLIFVAFIIWISVLSMSAVSALMEGDYGQIVCLLTGSLVAPAFQWYDRG